MIGRTAPTWVLHPGGCSLVSVLCQAEPAPREACLPPQNRVRAAAGPKPGGLRLPLLGILLLCVLGWAVLSLSATPSPGVFAPLQPRQRRLCPRTWRDYGRAWSVTRTAMDCVTRRNFPCLELRSVSRPGRAVHPRRDDRSQWQLYPCPPVSGSLPGCRQRAGRVSPHHGCRSRRLCQPGPAGPGRLWVSTRTVADAHCDAVPMLDIESAAVPTCGGISRLTRKRAAATSIAMAVNQPGTRRVRSWCTGSSWGDLSLLSATFLTTTVDLDLFLLPSAYPETCLQAGDNYVAAGRARRLFPGGRWLPRCGRELHAEARLPAGASGDSHNDSHANGYSHRHPNANAWSDCDVDAYPASAPCLPADGVQGSSDLHTGNGNLLFSAGHRRVRWHIGHDVE